LRSSLEGWKQTQSDLVLIKPFTARDVGPVYWPVSVTGITWAFMWLLWAERAWTHKMPTPGLGIQDKGNECFSISSHLIFVEACSFQIWAVLALSPSLPLFFSLKFPKCLYYKHKWLINICWLANKERRKKVNL
jgi:hypothetical protein